MAYSRVPYYDTSAFISRKRPVVVFSERLCLKDGESKVNTLGTLGYTLSLSTQSTVITKSIQGKLLLGTVNTKSTEL